MRICLFRDVPGQGENSRPLPTLLNVPRLTIGSSTDQHLQLPVEGVERRHAVITMGFGRRLVLRTKAKGVQVNGRKVNIPSFQCKVGDEIAIRQGSKEMPTLAIAKDFASGQSRVNWIDSQPENLSGKIIALPKREDINLPINEQLIVELYSK